MPKFRYAFLVGAGVLAAASIPMRPSSTIQAAELIRTAKVAFPAIQAASAPASGGPADQLPAGQGRDVTVRVCSTCHEVKTFAQKRSTEDEWDAVLDDMTGRGMNASDDDLATVRKYLTTYMAPAAQGKSPDAPSAPSKH